MSNQYFALLMCCAVTVGCELPDRQDERSSQARSALTAPTTIAPTSGYGDPGTSATIDTRGNVNWVGGNWYVPLPVSVGDVIGSVTALVRDNGQYNLHASDGNTVVMQLISRTVVGDNARGSAISNGLGTQQNLTVTPSFGYKVQAGEEMLVQFVGIKGGATPGQSTVPSMTGTVTVSPITVRPTVQIVVPSANWHIRAGNPSLDGRGFWLLEHNGSDELISDLPVQPGDNITSLAFHLNRGANVLPGDIQLKLLSRPFGSDPATVAATSVLYSVVSSGNAWTVVDIASTQTSILPGVSYWISVSSSQFLDDDATPMFDGVLVAFTRAM